MIDVVLPVLNERLALPSVLGSMPSIYRAIVVDNGSTDGSAELAASLGALVVIEEQRGFGAACWAGLQAATSDVVCFMDCDGSLDPRHLPLVSTPVVEGRADLVLGRRVASAGSWPVHARLANRVLAAQVRRKCHLEVTDIGPMRAARRGPSSTSAFVTVASAGRSRWWSEQRDRDGGSPRSTSPTARAQASPKSPAQFEGRPGRSGTCGRYSDESSRHRRRGLHRLSCRRAARDRR
jgi:hypothetical protein